MMMTSIQMTTKQEMSGLPGFQECDGCGAYHDGDTDNVGWNCHEYLPGGDKVLCQLCESRLTGEELRACREGGCDACNDGWAEECCYCCEVLDETTGRKWIDRIGALCDECYETAETPIECSVRMVAEQCDRVIVHPYAEGDEYRVVMDCSTRSAEVWFGNKEEEEEWRREWSDKDRYVCPQGGCDPCADAVAAGRVPDPKRCEETEGVKADLLAFYSATPEELDAWSQEVMGLATEDNWDWDGVRVIHWHRLAHELERFWTSEEEEEWHGEHLSSIAELVRLATKYGLPVPPVPPKDDDWGR